MPSKKINLLGRLIISDLRKKILRSGINGIRVLLKPRLIKSSAF